MGLVVSATASCGDFLGRRRSPTPPPPTSTAPTPAPDALQPVDTTLEPELVRVFRHFDADGDGRISAAEMRDSCGCTAAEAEEMIAAADSDGDGFISIDELGALFEDGDQTDTLRAAFAEYDENGDGVITAEELRRALRRLGLCGDEMTAERCVEIVAAVDRDGDGVISFDEFKAMMATKPAA
ncbi:hypothetical protein U9M48_022044 [Paspalum notatum var. saurae]|uniref:EF-hand domain-containing protein n=1 Tax=Paspalum notatum var. saurae TaxID=547442 RepID=A0AAQ3WTB4_PASNO